jgi:DedD protein
MMDRRVKERLVGATILVALIVLVVPELLSGPRASSTPPLEQGLPASTREVQVDLATSKATPEPQAASAASGGSPAAAPAGRTGPDATGAPGGQSSTAATSAAGSPAPPDNDMPPPITTLRAQASAPPLETPPPPPKSSAGTLRSATAGDSAAARRPAWAVQLGSFASKANAEKLVHQLQAAAGSSVYVVSGGSGSSLRYRVRMGPLADRGAAERVVLKLKAQGHAATIVTPSS